MIGYEYGGKPNQGQSVSLYNNNLAFGGINDNSNNFHLGAVWVYSSIEYASSSYINNIGNFAMSGSTVLNSSSGYPYFNVNVDLLNSASLDVYNFGNSGLQSTNILTIYQIP